MVPKAALDRVLEHVVEDRPAAPIERQAACRDWLSRVIAHTLAVAQLPTWEERHLAMQKASLVSG